MSDPFMDSVRKRIEERKSYFNGVKQTSVIPFKQPIAKKCTNPKNIKLCKFKSSKIGRMITRQEKNSKKRNHKCGLVLGERKPANHPFRANFGAKYSAPKDITEANRHVLDSYYYNIKRKKVTKTSYKLPGREK